MKAMVINRFGGPEVFEQTNIDAPVAGPGQILVDVAATSVNPIDTKIRSGAVAAIAPPFPAVLHGDVAGTVAAVGPGVTDFAVGDTVISSAGGVKGCGGALAGQTVLDARLAAHAPTSIPLATAAALPIVGLTAWEALVDRAAIKPGMRVLVHAGLGGVGHIGVQLARILGAEVFTTVSSAEKAVQARDLGGHTTINYRETSVDDYVAEHTGGQGFDVVFDTVGGNCLAASLQAAKVGGTVVSIAARSTQDLAPAHAKGLTLHVVFLLAPILYGVGIPAIWPNLTALSRLIDRGDLRLVEHPQRFTTTTIADAHACLESGNAIGKIVVENDL